MEDPCPQEVSSAVDLYLSVQVASEAELSALAGEASASADRSIARLDETIAYVDREMEKNQEASATWSCAGHATCWRPSSESF
jgi:hypothetical protein